MATLTNRQRDYIRTIVALDLRIAEMQDRLNAVDDGIASASKAVWALWRAVGHRLAAAHDLLQTVEQAALVEDFTAADEFYSAAERMVDAMEGYAARFART